MGSCVHTRKPEWLCGKDHWRWEHTHAGKRVESDSESTAQSSTPCMSLGPGERRETMPTALHRDPSQSPARRLSAARKAHMQAAPGSNLKQTLNLKAAGLGCCPWRFMPEAQPRALEASFRGAWAVVSRCWYLGPEDGHLSRLEAPMVLD